MERNTVILDLDKYNELRRFKEKMEDNFTHKVIFDIYYSGDTITYITNEKAVMEITEINKKLSKEYKELQKEISHYRRTSFSTDEILNMNWWKFKKLKKKLKKNL